MIDKARSLKIISGLVERFEEQLPSYKKSDYNETLTRRDFIDPMFKALGWDIDNSQGYAEAYREVVHEDKIKVAGAIKAPDYSFKLPGGKRLFFLEAKKPAVLIKEDIQPAYQLRRYGWSAKMPISLISDFEEFSVYDCTKKPKPTDKASVGRIKYLTYKDYIREFDFLWDTFSKERVLKGGFDRFLISDTSKKGTATVDKEFLLSLDLWRTELAMTINKLNPLLDEDELNYAVQQTIDRIIFLRIAEDRGVEPYGTLQDTVKRGDAYQSLYRLFLQADDKYNSGLFNFKKDRLSSQIRIDNKTLKGIVDQLYFPQSPYEFSVLSVEILGSAYEQFLGKQITLDAKHKAKIEEKPEVRKAGGVYYTPEYIVNYIVQQTVGKLVEGKVPKDVAKLKIVDPSCGSGSFLLGAYQFLLNWHKDYYTNNGKTVGKDKPLTPDGNLTTGKKKEILINNIYGVDIDTNAVEVTKLSLLLKCLEGETGASISTQMKLFHDRVLPTLDNNIKSGNSLIDVDYFDTQIDYGDERKVKPFSWQTAFPEVFKQGGFDAVIGNPPYVRQELLGHQKDYFALKYKVYHGMADLYAYFFEKGLSLLNKQGLFGIIVANKWIKASYGEPLRRWMREQRIYEIIDFGDLPVFQGATTYPHIIIASKEKATNEVNVTNVKTLQFDNLSSYVSVNRMGVPTEQLTAEAWNLVSPREEKLTQKLLKKGIPLGTYIKDKVYRGVLTGLNDAFVIDEETKTQLIERDPNSEDLIKPFLIGRDIKRYEPPKPNNYLIFTRRGIRINDYTAIKRHLEKFRTNLEPRPKDHIGEWDGRKPGSYKWYEIQDAVDYFEEFSKPKIIYPNICSKPEFTYDTHGHYTNQKCFIIPTKDLYLLGLLNSRLTLFLFNQLLPKLRGGFFEPSWVYLKSFPIKDIGKDKASEVKMRDEIVDSVRTILSLKSELSKTRLEHKQQQISQRITHLETRIDQLVYELYDLTTEEINVINNSD